MENVQHEVERMLFQVIGQEQVIEGLDIQAGGCINMAVSAHTADARYFVKWNELEFADMFEKEVRGLELLRAACPLEVPEVIGHGVQEEKAFLVLSYLEKGIESAQYWQTLGEGLAALHLNKQTYFGLDHDNYIGRLVQPNDQAESWIDFFRDTRLNTQLGLTIYNGYVSDSFIADFKAFLEKLPAILPDGEASLLHGDLWSGNAMAVSPDKASFFDPAVYCGAREMDLAMTRLFGGFDQRFYQAYHAIYPIPNHFEDLVDVYNLYPLMVHVNLFGPNAGYSGSVHRIIRRYL